MKEKEQEQIMHEAQALIDDINELEAIDIEQAWKKGQTQIRISRRNVWLQYIMRYAAMFSVPLLIATLALGYLHFMPRQQEVHYAEVRATAGSIIKYVLPDSSVVWLNAETTLRYPTKFVGDERRVEIDGEAYFEVKADKRKPFFVDTRSDMSVYVYGTKFNVTAYSDEQRVTTVLESGHVNVIAPNQEQFGLNPGEQMVYDVAQNKMIHSTADVYAHTAWREGKLIFRNAPLEEILNRLSKKYNVEIELNNPNGKQYNYRATFRNETLTQILDYLKHSARMNWRVTDSKQQTDGTFTRKRVIVDLY